MVTTQLMYGDFLKYFCVQIIHDRNSENITKIAALLTKLSQKQFSLGVYGMSVISEEHNLARYGVNIVNMQ